MPNKLEKSGLKRSSIKAYLKTCASVCNKKTYRYFTYNSTKMESERSYGGKNIERCQMFFNESNYKDEVQLMKSNTTVICVKGE